jgi:hypothetical protein
VKTFKAVGVQPAGAGEGRAHDVAGLEADLEPVVVARRVHLAADDEVRVEHAIQNVGTGGRVVGLGLGEADRQESPLFQALDDGADHGGTRHATIPK